MAMNTFKNGDVVKMDGNEEPCVVYRVTDDRIQMIVAQPPSPMVPLPHIKIEAMGFVPIDYLVPVNGHPKNMFAIDKILWMSGQTN